MVFAFLILFLIDYRCIEHVRGMLDVAGFTMLSEQEVWNLSANGKYYFIRNGASIVAFTVGGAYQLGNGFTLVGAHTDSPCLKLKAKSCQIKSNALVLNTQPYGGGLWHTWFDRDLGLAGRVILKKNGVLSSKLVRVNRPVARIPNLAIHLQSPEERKAFAVNLHDHGKAILSMDPDVLSSLQFDDITCVDRDRLHPAMLALIAKEIGENPNDIVDLELQLIDTQAPCRGGYSNEFVYSGRLDNLCSSYQATRALIDGAEDGTLTTQPNVRAIFLFDHEEVWSYSQLLFKCQCKTLCHDDEGWLQFCSGCWWYFVYGYIDYNYG